MATTDARMGAFTIVSRNYLPQARVLAASYLRHHPGHRFFVVLADEPAADDGAGEPFELLPVRDVPIPNPDAFPYQYSILEFNTAVKPFAMHHLLEAFDLQALMYIDPDIMVFRPLAEAWTALESHDVVLTPHMREPFNDDAAPSELGILQSGTYNLGYLGLRRGEVARRLLAWWSERLYTDCVVDIPRGLFVDQKWMDLAPAYFGGTCILRDPTYNVAYWNLHERTVAQDGAGGYLVDGAPLAFFHFSGYSPARPERLSKHQSRHQLSALPAVRALCDQYAAALDAAGAARMAGADYAFGRLANGVEVPRAVNAVVLHCVRHGIPFPSPRTEADAFCRFLATPDARVSGAPVAPLVLGIRQVRPDVARAFPGSAHDRDDAGFLAWLRDSGAAEEQLESLLAGYGDLLTTGGTVERLLRAYDRRSDLREAFPDAFASSAGYARLAEWVELHGIREEDLGDDAGARIRAAEAGFARVVQAYFMRADLQAAFPLLYRDSDIRALAQWFTANLRDFPQLSEDDVRVFERAALARRDDLLLASLRYNATVRDAIAGLPSALNANRIRDYLATRGAEAAWPFVLKTLLAGDWIPPIEQYRAFCEGNPHVRHMFPRRDASPDDALQCAHHVIDRFGFSTGHSAWNGWARAVLDACRVPLRAGANVFGYLRNPTGMGESGRSMARTIEAAGVPATVSTLPGPVRHEPAGLDVDLPALFGQPDSGLATNVVVANADATTGVRDWLPVHLWGGARTNIGYWVWETEALPARFAGSARGLDAIWTPSEYSAAAIRKVTDVPVHVVPHTLDLDVLDRAESRRERFGLPADKVLFGYFFDSNSVLERKNPEALLRAFRKAFAGNPGVALVLKVNEPRPGHLAYERLKASAAGLDVTWVEEALDRADTCDLMKSLDAYVSLHRSEGFGLTMAEAMAMGLPVVATAYSGNMDFMDDQVAMLVPARTITTTRPYGPYPAGTRWADPDVDAAAAAMSALLDAGLRERLGARARDAIRQRLDRAAIGRAARALLDARPTPP